MQPIEGCRHDLGDLLTERIEEIRQAELLVLHRLLCSIDQSDCFILAFRTAIETQDFFSIRHDTSFP